jgi:hypothetical protein
LWQDLIGYAPPGWVTPVATLIATTSFLRGRRLQAWIAAVHALDDGPDQTRAGDLDEHLARIWPQ